MRVHSEGFTLLEMLLAITMIGIMLILIGSALTSSRHTLEMTNRYVSRLTEVRAAQDFIRQALQQALPLALANEAQPKDNVLTGNDQTLRFVAPLPSSLRGGLQTHSLTLALSSTGAKDLIVVFTPISPADTRPWGEPQYLLHDVRSIRLAYRGLDNAQVPTGWIDTWPWNNRLPNYVRVEMEVEGPVQWPTLTVALRSNMDSSSAAAQ
jgi:general secretion pathway protein J